MSARRYAVVDGPDDGVPLMPGPSLDTDVGLFGAQVAEFAGRLTPAPPEDEPGLVLAFAAVRPTQTESPRPSASGTGPRIRDDSYSPAS